MEAEYGSSCCAQRHYLFDLRLGFLKFQRESNDLLVFHGLFRRDSIDMRRIGAYRGFLSRPGPARAGTTVNWGSDRGSGGLNSSPNPYEEGPNHG